MKFKRRFYRKFRYNRKRSFLFIFFFLLCLSFGLGYSLISTDLNIFGTTVLRDNRWSVYFDNIQEIEGSVSPTVEPEITDNTTVSFSAKLKKPGDKFEFLIDVVNDGTIDAKIGNISMSPILTTEQQQFFEYEVTYESGVALNINQGLDAGSTETLKVSFKYLEQEDNSLYPDTDQTFNVVLTGEYVQGKGTSVNHQYLYDVLRKEAESGGLAKKYTGSHHDSFTEEPSKDIYHWYATNTTAGTEVKNKNNVIFANHCWQMLRTTDTGGVKMIYNGEVENNQCLNTRSSHVGYLSRTSLTLNSNYWYGTDYTYDSTNNTFSISGTTEQTTWNSTNGPGLVGKYTCKSTSVDGTCSKLYLVESYYNTSSAYVIPLQWGSNYSQIGRLQFNANSNSPTYVGYMYGDEYIYYNNINSTTNQSFSGTNTLLISNSLSTTYWYADSISYDSTTMKYSLVNPYQISSTSDYPSLVGKYTFRNTNQTNTGSSVYYIAVVNGSTMYYRLLSGGNLLSDYEPIIIGDSITDNGNGTYSINNQVSIASSEWYTNYNSYKNKYVCNNNSLTCENPRYIVTTTSTNYTFLPAEKKIMLGKTRNGLTLTDTLLIRFDEWYSNYNNYGDYKYTCHTENATCTEETLRMIDSYNSTGYKYASNHYYGSSVTWDGTNYTLVDPIEIENYNNLTNLSTHHFMCISNGAKTCQKVAYIYYYTGTGTMYYILLSDGITTVAKALEDMLTKNTTNSTIKSGIDAWYKHYLLEYDNYIEDTVFCNKRNINKLGGWDPNGGITTDYLEFKDNDGVNSLGCPNITDKFSVVNPDALLTYKVGLMSSSEKNNISIRTFFDTGSNYWLDSPSRFFQYRANGLIIDGGSSTGGDGVEQEVSGSRGVRPVISLKPKTKYLSGDGSMADPYVIIE